MTHSGGEARTEAPHVVISAAWSYAIYSDQEFLTPPRQIGLYGSKKDAGHLRALSVYLSSSIVKYYLFFQVPDWGIERDRIELKDVKSIPVPQFEPEQITKLSAFQISLAKRESQGNDADELQKELDDQIISVLRLPRDIAILSHDFASLRLTVNEGQISNEAIKKPTAQSLTSYGELLAKELDDFVEDPDLHHKITIVPSESLIHCSVELVKSRKPFDPVVKQSNKITNEKFAKLQSDLEEQFSQWVYIQRGLRVFHEATVDIVKPSRSIDWSRTQALNDADDLIGEILDSGSHQ